MAKELTTGQLARREGVHINSVYYWMFKLGLPYRRTIGGRYRIDLETFKEWKADRLTEEKTAPTYIP